LQVFHSKLRPAFVGYDVIFFFKHGVPHLLAQALHNIRSARKQAVIKKSLRQENRKEKTCYQLKKKK